MSPNDKQSSDANMTRKQRRAAERAARKTGKSGKSDAMSSSSGGSSGPSMAVVSVVAVSVGIVLVAALLVLSGALGGDEGTTIEEPDTAAPAAELRDGLTLVAPDVTPVVTVEVFEDVRCPHCQTFTERVEPLIIAEHVTPGTTSLTYNDYIIFTEGDKSLDAAVAMRAADALGGAFWDYHHVLYHNAEDGPFTEDWFVDIAESVGLDREAFRELLDDEALRDDVAASQELGSSYGVGSTPSVVVNGELLVAPSWEDLDAAIVAAAEAAG